MLATPGPLISAGEGLARPLGARDATELAELLHAWQIPHGREQAVHDMALASLDQVKASTEYDDARALLTIVAFLTALAGAVFNRFGSTYDLPTWRELASNWHYVWPAVTYAMFGAYAVIVAVSAYVIFGAMKPTIYEPGDGVSNPRGALDLTFHARLLHTHPRAWGQSFVELTGEGVSGPDNLKAQYGKYYILETYLLAQKIASKLKKAAPAVRWLQLSMLFLAAFIVSYGTTLVFVPAPPIK